MFAVVGFFKLDEPLWLIFPPFLCSELDEIERFVRSEVEKKPERPVLTHHAQTKSPPAPPSPRKPVEVPVIGDPNGRRSLSPVDFAKAPPIPVLMLTCNRKSRFCPRILVKEYSNLVSDTQYRCLCKTST